MCFFDIFYIKLDIKNKYFVQNKQVIKMIIKNRFLKNNSVIGIKNNDEFEIINNIIPKKEKYSNYFYHCPFYDTLLVI